MRFEKFGIFSRSSSSSQFSSIIRPGYRELSVMTMISRSIPSPFESGPWIFPKYSSFELISSKYSTGMPVFAVNCWSVGDFFVFSSMSM